MFIIRAAITRPTERNAYKSPSSLWRYLFFPRIAFFTNVLYCVLTRTFETVWNSNGRNTILIWLRNKRRLSGKFRDAWLRIVYTFVHRINLCLWIKFDVSDCSSFFVYTVRFGLIYNCTCYIIIICIWKSCTSAALLPLVLNHHFSGVRSTGKCSGAEGNDLPLRLNCDNSILRLTLLLQNRFFPYFYLLFAGSNPSLVTSFIFNGFRK